MLSHTAGLSYNWFPAYGPDDPVPTMAQTLRGEPPANTPPVRASLLPGSQFRYSGSHYAVLQQLLTDVTKTPFDELMRTLVFEPAGMADSSYRQDFPASDRARWRSGTTRQASPWPAAGRRCPRWPEPACGPRRVTWSGWTWR